MRKANLLPLSRVVAIALCSALLISCGGGSESLKLTSRATLVEMAAFLDSQLADGYGFEEQGDTVISESDIASMEVEIEAIKARFMTHDLSLSSVKSYLEGLRSSSLPGVAQKAQSLSPGLMENRDYITTWKNIYGRVFDSAVVSDLVNNAPPEVLQAMTLMGKGLGELLSREIERSRALELKLESKLYDLVTKKDPRFWFPQIPTIMDIRENGYKDSVRKLITYLMERRFKSEMHHMS